MEGTLVKWFDDKGYGFIRTDNGERFFVHNWDIYTEPNLYAGSIEWSSKSSRRIKVQEQNA